MIYDEALPLHSTYSTDKLSFHHSADTAASIDLRIRKFFVFDLTSRWMYSDRCGSSSCRPLSVRKDVSTACAVLSSGPCVNLVVYMGFY